jgi:hypothetical protein
MGNEKVDYAAHLEDKNYMNRPNFVKSFRQKEERVRAANILPQANVKFSGDKETAIKAIGDAALKPRPSDNNW